MILTNLDSDVAAEAEATNGISLVIPAKNEEAAITMTVERARAVLAEAKLENFEIVVVDDGSTDRTGELAAAAGARVLRHPHNAGYGHSLKDGIRQARYDTIVITDADGTYPLERIPDLLALYRQGFDMVVGQRTGVHVNSSPLKGWLRYILRWLVEYSAGRKIPDINSGLRVFSRSQILGYFSHLCDTFSFTTSSTLAYMMTGKFVGYLPIEYHPRIGNTHVKLFRESLRTLQYIIQAVTYYNPLKIFLLMSALCVAFSAVSFGCGLVFQMHTGFYFGVGGGLVAMVVFSLGLLADLLKQIMAK